MSEHAYDDGLDGYDELAARLDQLEAAAEQIAQPDPGYGYADQIASESVFDGISARQHLEQAAEAARQAVCQQTASLPSAPPTEQAETTAALRQAEANNARLASQAARVEVVLTKAFEQIVKQLAA